MSDSPVSRSMAKLRDEGYVVGIVQRSVPTKPRPTSIDLFGVADLEAIAPDHTLYVQVCRDSDLTAHLVTCVNEPRLLKLLECRAREFEIWSWAKRGNRWRVQRLHGQWTMSGVVFVGVEPAVSPATPMDGLEVQASASAPGPR